MSWVYLSFYLCYPKTTKNNRRTTKDNRKQRASSDAAVQLAKMLRQKWLCDKYCNCALRTEIANYPRLLVWCSSDRAAGVGVSLGTLDLVRVDGRPCQVGVLYIIVSSRNRSRACTSRTPATRSEPTQQQQTKLRHFQYAVRSTQ